MKPVDKTKKSNIKCEHCKHFIKTPKYFMPEVYMCGITGEDKNYYNRCKHFEWADKYMGDKQ